MTEKYVTIGLNSENLNVFASNRRPEYIVAQESEDGFYKDIARIGLRDVTVLGIRVGSTINGYFEDRKYGSPNRKAKGFRLSEPGADKKAYDVARKIAQQVASRESVGVRDTRESDLKEIMESLSNISGEEFSEIQKRRFWNSK